MPKTGWKRLLSAAPKSKPYADYRMDAYSEFMPAPRLGVKPYGTADDPIFADDDPWGWPVTEEEERLELCPGLMQIAQHVGTALLHLSRGEPAHGIARSLLADNPCWPPELAARAGNLRHDRLVLILPLALARTQDDKGRVRWTLFGSSEQGPSVAFWKSFFTAPGREMPAEGAVACICSLLAEAFGETVDGREELRRTGFRILAAEGCWGEHGWSEGPRPSWTEDYLWRRGASLRGIRYLLSFEPFAALPVAVRRAYLAGELHLLPFPGSLVFWGAPHYLRLRRELPLAQQIPLLHLVERHEGPTGVRVPQSGWMHELKPGTPPPENHHGPVRNTYQRTHRWARVLRHEDELALLEREDKLAHVLFSTQPVDVELYGKPMARNAQIWTQEYRLLLDGPRAGRTEIHRAFEAIGQGGIFGYRFQFPAMRIGSYEAYWHRPLVAHLSRQSDSMTLVPNAPMGYLTAYRADDPCPEKAVDLWPRPLRRESQLAALDLFDRPGDRAAHHLCREALELLRAADLIGARRLPRPFARCLLTLSKHKSLEDWLAAIEQHGVDRRSAGKVVVELSRRLEPAETALSHSRRPPAIPSLTFSRSGRRAFEVEYWKKIAFLSEGRFVNKDNADCILDPVTRPMLKHHHRDLEALGDYLLDHYRRTIGACGMAGRAVVGDLPFRWQTDFDFSWFGGWQNNQMGKAEERNLIVVIPGRDRKRAIVMADHYDTAYMEDVYDRERGGSGARLAAAGADDNHSATAALMQAAPILLDLSRQGRLGCDVWLVHLTGEEFPSDCMGARNLCQRLVQGDLCVRISEGRELNLSRVRVKGVYVMDMIAHNNDHDRDVFQISPGTGPESAQLALLAHGAAQAWNRMAERWNRHTSRRGRGRSQRRPDGRHIPATALHPELQGEVRLPMDPRSTLYNTDGQIFSDAGIPVVLFMENYDINRTGYHDTRDTMANIDLDYGSALAAIAIESVARAATQLCRDPL
jgi:hypothetical protein